MNGPRPLRPDLRLVGVARTLRYLPAREDLDTLERWRSCDNPQRKIADTIQPGEVLVIEARGSDAAGCMGGLLIIRMMKRGAGGVVADGPFRDTEQIATLELPTYSVGMNANTNLVTHHPEELDVAIGCGGVHVRPGDVIFGDSEGVICIPRALAEEIAEQSAAQEDEEQWIEQMLLQGASLQGTYPMGATTREKFMHQRGLT